MDVECIIAPSMIGLRALDMDEARWWHTPEALGAKLAVHREIHYDLIVTAAELEVKYTGITVKNMLAAQEMFHNNNNFHLLQPVRGDGSWKCNCKEYFRDGICSYSILVPCSGWCGSPTAQSLIDIALARFQTAVTALAPSALVSLTRPNLISKQ
jgi:hypothetical protein